MQHDTIVVAFYDRIEDVIKGGETHPCRGSPEVKRSTPGTGTREPKADSEQRAMKRSDVGKTQRMVEGIDVLMRM
jgi:hypothetical protein